MDNLNFPKFNFRFKSTENKISIFDEVRKKFVVLQPEEWVRQHCIQYLIQIKNFPKNHINVEKQLLLNNLRKRYDIVVFKPNGNIKIIVECKAPSTVINQSIFNQIAVYNMALNAEYLMLTNGINHYYCKVNHAEKKYVFLKDLPSYTN